METIRGQGLPGVQVGTGAADKWMGRTGDSKSSFFEVIIYFN